MKKHRNFHEGYLSLLRKIIEKLGYEVNGNDNTAWILLILETVALIAYYVVVLFSGEPTPVSLFLNTALIYRFFLGNCRKAYRANEKAKGNKGYAKTYIKVHTLTSVAEMVIILAVCISLAYYDIGASIERIWFETFLCVSIFFMEGWKDIHVGFFDAVPKY